MQMASFGLVIVLGTWITLLLQQDLDLPVPKAAILGSMPLLLGVISRPLGGLIVARVGARPLLMASFAMTALGCFILAETASMGAAMVEVVLVGGRCSLPFATLFKRAATLFPSRAGAAMGLINTMGIAMIVGGAPLVGYASQRSGNYRLFHSPRPFLPGGWSYQSSDTRRMS
jgi:NNP family nitrate/nitrite transporter-like MFS transporter